MPLEIPEGEEFSKLIINNYLLNNSNLSKEEKIKLALKYQIFTNDTSLFAKVELSDNVSKEMKSKILGDKKNNRISIFKRYDYYRDEEFRFKKAKKLTFLKRKRDLHLDAKLAGERYRDREYAKEYMHEKEEAEEEAEEEESEDEAGKENFSNSEKKINIDEKEKVMKIIRTQDFNKGNWDENNETKKIKQKYIKEYNLLKGLKDKKINDSITMIIIIIYFIYKEYHELLSELSRIIKKAKNFIRKETNTSYENIIKQIGI